jgi:hypothetical protein
MGAAVLAAAAAILPGSASAAAQATSRLSWVANGWDIHELDELDPATAAYFYDTPASYGTSPNPAAPTVKDKFTTTAAADFDSYAQFAADLADGAISPAFGWVMYDPEDWANTPVDEQQDPGKYLKLFGQLAHANGYKVIEAPARDLGNVDTACPKESGETLDKWYIRCGIAGEAAVDSDIVLVQTQVDTTTLASYDWLFSNAADQISRNNPACGAYAEVSTSYGTAAQMAAAAQSVTADGFYVSVSDSTIPQADQFLEAMEADGY